MKKLSIAIVSKADESGGGASRIAEQLTCLLNAAGHKADHWLVQSADLQRAHYHYLYGKVWHKPITAVKNAFKKVGLPEIPPLEYAILNHRARLMEYDVVHFHDISSVISPLTVYWTSRKRPTIWTFHDSSPFTGGCLQPLDCEKFKTRCHECPQLGDWPLDTKIDFTGLLQDIKRFVHRRGRIHAVAPSRWESEMAHSSGLLLKPPEVIANGVDTTIFQPLDKRLTRSALGLPLDRKIVLIATYHLSSKSKGVRYALQALDQVRDLQPFVLAIGHADPYAKKEFEPLDCRLAGFVADDLQRARYFACADVNLNCSLAESFSLVTAEAMACGAPTVGFAVGGVAEIVEQGSSGFLVPPTQIAPLAHGLRTALSGDTAAQWGKNARERIERRFSHELLLEKYLELYQRVIVR